MRMVGRFFCITGLVLCLLTALPGFTNQAGARELQDKPASLETTFSRKGFARTDPVKNKQLQMAYDLEQSQSGLESKMDLQARPWNVSIYRGQFTDTNLQSIFFRRETDYQPSFITVFAMSRPLEERFSSFALESEGQLVVHSGRMSHLEYNGLFILRHTPFESLPLSLAIGEGLSLATQNPGLENQRKSWMDPNQESEYSKKLLNYLLFEVDYALSGEMHKPRVFMRVHHRSGIYGLFCPPTCGSNFMAYGLKFSY